VAEGPLKVSSGFVIGRLKRGITIDSARSELAALALQGRQKLSGSRMEWAVEISRLHDDFGLEVRPALLVLLATTGCVLLIACTNIANLLLAQAAARRQELAIRAALGANRTRLFRQLFTESLILALVGSLAGLVAASTLSRAMVAFYPGALPRVTEGGERIPVLVFAMIIAGLSAVFFGTVPALLATRQRSLANLRTGRVWMERNAGRWRNALIGVQVAMTAMVLISAGLLLKSFAALRSIDLGFEHARIFTAQVVLPESAYSKPDDQTRFALSWIGRLEAIPGVEGAAVTNSLPLAANVLITLSFSIPGQAEDQLAGGRSVAGNYFEVMGLHMKEGRPLGPADDGRRDVVVVNETFARHFLKESPATGMPIHYNGANMATIVGVVHDLRNLRLKHTPEAEIYFPFATLPSGYLDVVARTALPPSEIAAVARHELRTLDPGLVLTQVSTMDQILDENVAQPRFLAMLLSLFAIAALSLAAIGVYGIISQGVRTRTAEFAIRMTLGAKGLDIFWMIVRQGLRAPLLGLTIGVAGTWATGRLLESFLYGVAPRDPLVLVVAALFVFAVCLFSCGVPALQSCRLEVARALRDE
jgi:putative ABC transport system permease protein